MNKRLRKKKKLGEFAEYGFCVQGELNSDIDMIEWTDKFIFETEKLNLQLGGGFTKNTVSAVVETAKLRNPFNGKWKSRIMTKKDRDDFEKIFTKIFEWNYFSVSKLQNINLI